MPDAFYQPHHWTQYCGKCSRVTRTSGCTWTTFTTGLDASTGGRIKMTPDQVHALVKPSEEHNPATPGWALEDCDLAAKRLKVGFEIRSGWANLERDRDLGLYVVLPGDSDQFSNATCSGDFDGDHCTGLRPGGTDELWPLDDPICAQLRDEKPSVVRKYATKFNPAVRYGVFTSPVPLEDDVKQIPIGVVGPYLVDLSIGDQLYDPAYEPFVKVTTPQTVDGFFQSGEYISLAVVVYNARRMVFAKISTVTVRPKPVVAKSYPVTVAVTVGGKPVKDGTVTLP